MQCFVSRTSEACIFLFVQVADISAVVSVEATVFKDQKPSIVYLLGNNVLCKALSKQANLFYCHKTNNEICIRFENSGLLGYDAK